MYSESVVAKIWAVAEGSLSETSPPTSHPEYTVPGGDEYVFCSHEFWTSGFFPGSLAVLYERQRLWKNHSMLAGTRCPHPLVLQHAIRWWSDELHSQAARRDNHDLGFMIQPWAQPLWELDGDRRAFAAMVTAAHSLAGRFDERVGAIRSWDTCFTTRYRFNDINQDFLVIIDSMMNLDLLFYVARESNNEYLANIATRHAKTLAQTHIRADSSTCHVVNFEQRDGSIKQRMTNQGYSDSSCWARGQAWGITGFAQTYGWTRDAGFLHVSCRLADYFLQQLTDDCVPFWDFAAPRPGPKDTSAAMIAAYGMLLLDQHLQRSTDKYLTAALRLVHGVLASSMASDASFGLEGHGGLKATNKGLQTILSHATINNYEYAPRRFADHGLVYADYYFLLVGNELLRMGVL
ncbi:hypothetical protein KC333_g3942 [Hortaea werneckii]|nr:hypothetical protein KC333_g3942 [Hortaea werneckii]KAI7313722.1 hypothetical protein KC326_g5432 [Hortaea werneckii]